MSQDKPLSETRRGFLGAATVATAAAAVGLTASPAAKGQDSREFKIAQSPPAKPGVAGRAGCEAGRLVEACGHGDPEGRRVQAGARKVRTDLSAHAGELRVLDHGEGQARTRSGSFGNTATRSRKRLPPIRRCLRR